MVKGKDSWLRQLLIGILGTSIGVGLTFMGNRMVENYKQRQAQHETAVLAVCDIDEIIHALKDEKQMEDSLFHIVMFMSTHQDQIDFMSRDTINMAFDYLYNNPTKVKKWTSDTKENAFNSGMEARMNLGNNQFYDNVQSCYYWRRILMNTIEKSAEFRKPLTNEYYEQFLQALRPEDLDESGNPIPPAKVWLLKQVFAQAATSIYIKRYFARRERYRDAIVELERLNRENKLLMNITDEDIEAYIRQNEDKVQAASVDLLIGSWERDTGGDITMTYIFHEDHTSELVNHVVNQIAITLREEHTDVPLLMPATIRATGTWELKGDSLIVHYKGETAEYLSFEMDTSNFPEAALERLKDSLDIKIQAVKDMILDALKKQDVWLKVTISFDQSGNAMMLSDQVTTPSGQKETTSWQLYRKE